jgi:hypothetical protein
MQLLASKREVAAYVPPLSDFIKRERERERRGVREEEKEVVQVQAKLNLLSQLMRRCSRHWEKL